MPAKIDTELNLRFLYICFKHSNFSTVDFHEVASYFQIKAPAARMRLMRLRQALEAEASREGFSRGERGRKRLNPFKAKDKTYAFHEGEDDDDETLDDMPLMQRLRRVKREDGFMIKDEEGTLIKHEDGAIVKDDEDGSWCKREGGLDEEEEKRVKTERRDGDGGDTVFESDNSQAYLQNLAAPVGMGHFIKSENTSLDHAPPPFQQRPLFSSFVKTDPGVTRNNPNNGGDKHAPFTPVTPGPYTFRVYDPPNFAQQHNSKLKSEDSISHGHSDPFPSYYPSRPDVFNQFTPAQSADSRGNGHITASSPFRLDMFNTALQSSLARGGEDTPRPERIDSVHNSPRFKENAPEPTLEERHSPLAVLQPSQNHAFDQAGLAHLPSA